MLTVEVETQVDAGPPAAVAGGGRPASGPPAAAPGPGRAVRVQLAEGGVAERDTKGPGALIQVASSAFPGLQRPCHG